MSERDKWIYELGQRHPNLSFDVSDAYIERRGKDKDEIAKLKALMIEAAEHLTCEFDECDDFDLADRLREAAK